MLFPPRADEAALRHIPDDDFLRLLSPQLVPVTRPGTVVLFPFSKEPVRAAVHEAKYHGAGRALDLLAQALADYLRDADEQARTIALVPVPLGRTRRKERGFNQAEEIARRALRKLGENEPHRFILVPDMLIRTRETASQVSLPRHRQNTPRRAGGPPHQANPAYTYIILDDGVTTGATLQAAIDALKTAGAVTIIPLALAH